MQLRYLLGSSSWPKGSQSCEKTSTAADSWAPLWHHRAKVLASPHPFPLPHVTVFSLLWHISQAPSAVSAVWSRHLCLSCYLLHVRRTELLMNMRPASDSRHQDACCILCFIILLFRRPGACREARRAGQRRSRRGPKSHFPHGPSWHRFQAACISLEYYSSPCTSSHAARGSSAAIIILHLVFPCLPG